MRELHRRLGHHDASSQIRRSFAAAVFVEERPDGFLTGVAHPDDGTLHDVIDMYTKLGKPMVGRARPAVCLFVCLFGGGFEGGGIDVAERV